jgi:anaerobic magnesium-protoporphyrin IX monomethyl ester cyclase
MILINPRSRRLGYFVEYVPVTVPISIGYLAAFLRAQGESVTIHDEEIQPLHDDHLDYLVAQEELPLVIGISCVTAGFIRTMELSRIIKRRYPASKIVVGGIHPTVHPQEVLEQMPVDAVVRGEGEIALLKLLEVFRSGQDFKNIDGISFRQNGRIVHNPRGPLIDLKNVPAFPYRLFDNHRQRYDFGVVLTSRGCPYNCAFCSQRAITRRTVRYVEVDKVMENLKELAFVYDQHYVTFFDDNFIIKKDRIFEICEGIIQHDIQKKITFDCQARGDAITPEILQILKKANFRVIHFGIETGSDRLLKLIDKGETVEQMRQGVRLTKKYGFLTSGTFILGLPSETKSERRSTYEFAQELDLDFARFNNATPYPGTKLYQIALEEGIFRPGENYANLNSCGTLVEDPFKGSRLSYVPAGSSEKELRQDLLKFNLFFMLGPRRLLRLLRERVGPGNTFSLPKDWYRKPKDCLAFLRFGLSIAVKFFRIWI